MTTKTTAPVAAIEVDHLVKTYRVPERSEGWAANIRSLFNRQYKEVRAVDDISFKIATGERVGFLGPNGAGKTTTLKMLSGLLHPTSGQLRVAGFVPFERSPGFLRSITYVAGQKERLIWDLPPLDTFLYHQAVFRIGEAEYKETLQELIRLLEIQHVVATPARRLSLGERMRCELAAALIHRPRVLFLDEPTIGLDVHMQHVIRQMVKGYNERFGATVILTSHDLRDVEALCPRIVVIDGGKILYDGQRRQFVERFARTRQIRVQWQEQVDRALLARFSMAHIEDLPDGETSLTVETALVREVMSTLEQAAGIRALHVQDPPIETVFVELYRQRAAERINGLA